MVWRSIKERIDAELFKSNAGLLEHCAVPSMHMIHILQILPAVMLQLGLGFRLMYPYN